MATDARASVVTIVGRAYGQQGFAMTTAAHIPTTVLVQGRRVTPLSPVKATDCRFDANETCARCGPGTQAQFRWVFPPVSELTHEHCELYLCAHCSSVGERRLLTTSILHVDRAPHQH
jgi:hypothetical protein